jgi:hypothetical protein
MIRRILKYTALLTGLFGTGFIYKSNGMEFKKGEDVKKLNLIVENEEKPSTETKETNNLKN